MLIAIAEKSRMAEPTRLAVPNAVPDGLIEVWRLSVSTIRAASGHLVDVLVAGARQRHAVVRGGASHGASWKATGGQWGDARAVAGSCLDLVAEDPGTPRRARSQAESEDPGHLHDPEEAVSAAYPVQRRSCSSDHWTRGMPGWARRWNEVQASDREGSAP